jgi:hypothetical protein
MSDKEKPFNGEYRHRVSDDGRWVVERKRPGETKFSRVAHGREESKAEARRIAVHRVNVVREGDSIR